MMVILHCWCDGQLQEPLEYWEVEQFGPYLVIGHFYSIIG